MTRLPLADYLASPGLWRFIAGDAHELQEQHRRCPGVFEDNPLRFPMGTVWTLKYEVLCYVGVFAIGLVGLLRSRVGSPLAARRRARRRRSPASTSSSLTRPRASRPRLRLPLIFACGGALYVGASAVRLSGRRRRCALAVATVARSATPSSTSRCCSSRPPMAMLWLALAPALDASGRRAARRSLLRDLSLRLAGAAGPACALARPRAARRSSAGAGRHARRRGPVLVRRREAGTGPEGAGARPPDAQDDRARSALTARRRVFVRSRARSAGAGSGRRRSRAAGPTRRPRAAPRRSPRRSGSGSACAGLPPTMA